MHICGCCIEGLRGNSAVTHHITIPVELAHLYISCQGEVYLEYPFKVFEIHPKFPIRHKTLTCRKHLPQHSKSIFSLDLVKLQQNPQNEKGINPVACLSHLSSLFPDDPLHLQDIHIIVITHNQVDYELSMFNFYVSYHLKGTNPVG